MFLTTEIIRWFAPRGARVKPGTLNHPEPGPSRSEGPGSGFWRELPAEPGPPAKTRKAKPQTRNNLPLLLLPPRRLLIPRILRILAFKLRIDHGHQRHIINAAYRTAQLQHMHGFLQTQQNRTNGIRAANLLHEVIGNVPSRQVGEDQR